MGLRYIELGIGSYVDCSNLALFVSISTHCQFCLFLHTVSFACFCTLSVLFVSAHCQFCLFLHTVSFVCFCTLSVLFVYTHCQFCLFLHTVSFVCFYTMPVLFVFMQHIEAATYLWYYIFETVTYWDCDILTHWGCDIHMYWDYDILQLCYIEAVIIEAVTY